MHHTSKNATDGVAAGQGLRGSSDIHALGDSNLYLPKIKELLILSSEHWAASAPVHLELVATEAEMTRLEVIADPDDGKRCGINGGVVDLLVEGQVLTRTKLRDSLGIKNERPG
jgi:hypothetical protein